jgi:cytochrome c-type biogenesis protein CcsB
MKALSKIVPWLFLALFASEIIAVMMPKKDGEFHVREFGRLPVLLNGRIQPFDSVAHNALLQIRSTGSLPLEGNGADGSWGDWNELRKNPKAAPLTERAWWQFGKHPKKLKSTEWLLEVMTRPEDADIRPIFLIHHAELIGDLKLQDKGIENSGLHYYTFDELKPTVQEIFTQVEPILKREEENRSSAEKRTVFEKQLMKLYNAVTLYQRLKYTLQPEGVDNWSQELAEFHRNIAPARAALHSGENGQSMDQELLQRISKPFQELQQMARFGYALIVPPLDPETSRDSWQNFGNALLESAHTDQLPVPLTDFAAMATAYRNKDATEFNRAVDDYKAWLAPNFAKEVKKGRAEFYYNDVKAFLHATIMYIFALVLGAFALLTMTTIPGVSETLRRSAYYIIILAWVVHTFGLIFRMVLEGRPPVTNLYSSAIFIGWGACLLGIVLERIYRLGIGNIVSAFVGFVTLLIAYNLALDGDTMEMLRAVLDTNFWLATHVVVVTLGYASTFVAGLLAIIYIGVGVFTPLLREKLRPRERTGTKPIKTGGQVELGKALAKMVYGIVCFATLFSFTGTVLGGIWADQSWGRFWGWDPKENGALLIVLWNAIILHARWGGIVRERGIMNLAVFGNIVTSFSWFGVNMLGIGLHSYGFMDAAFKWLILFIASQVVIIGLGLLPLHLWRSFRAPAPSAASGDGSVGTPAAARA